MSEEARVRSVSLLQGENAHLKDDLQTMRKATSSRIRKQYAQDNFLSHYSNIMQTVRQKAKDIADVEQTSLRNRVSALERHIKRDAVYKAALKTRTEIAEQAADKR